MVRPGPDRPGDFDSKRRQPNQSEPLIVEGDLGDLGKVTQHDGLKLLVMGDKEVTTTDLTWELGGAAIPGPTLSKRNCENICTVGWSRKTTSA